MIKVKIIELPREGLTAQQLEDVINKFIVSETPKNIICISLLESYSYLMIVYVKD